MSSSTKPESSNFSYERKQKWLFPRPFHLVRNIVPSENYSRTMLSNLMEKSGLIIEFKICKYPEKCVAGRNLTCVFSTNLINLVLLINNGKTENWT